MSERPHELVPVDAMDDFFVVSQDWLTADLPFPRWSERERLLRRGYSLRPGTVHFEGRSRTATILEPPEKDDQFFAELDQSGHEAEKHQLHEVEVDDIDRFWAKLQMRFGRSEGVLPEQCTDIGTSFVEPRLALAYGSGEHVTWGRLRERSYLLISGAPGSGKTTLLRQWLLWHADRAQRRESPLIPLCLPLRDFSPADSVEHALRREAVATGADWLARDLKALADRGALAIAFDGVDEVPFEDRQAALEKMGEFVRQFPDCRYLVTTRPGINVQFSVGLLRANLLPFDYPRLRQLAYYKLYAQGSWKSFATRMEAEPALEWVVGNPLALSLVIARYLRREIRPSFVGEIISSVVDMFVDTWDSSRGVVRTKRPMLSPSSKRKVLAWVAEHRQVGDNVEVPLLDLVDDQKADLLLATLSEHTGLLRCQEDGSWVMRDKALEDYFRATLWVSALSSKVSDFRNRFRRPLSSARSYFLRFVGFMSSDADAQIREVLKRMAEPELATAVRLTEVLSQQLPLRKGTLENYAKLVADALQDPLRDAEFSSIDHGARQVFYFTIKWPDDHSQRTNELSALVAALHRSRDGIGADAIRAVIQADATSHLGALEGLLGAEGELTCERTAETMTWTVAQIMPEMPSGPDEQLPVTLSQTMH